MGIFVVLGAALIAILKQGLDLWQVGEARKQAHEKASFVLSYFREDLTNVYSQSAGSRPVRFLCDLEPNSQERGTRRQRLRFVRTRKGESQHPIASLGGAVLESSDYYDHFRDLEEAKVGNLRAGAGLEEVCYFLDTDPDTRTLWRGIRSPPGGEGSYLLARGEGDSIDPARCQPLATGILYVEFRFWTQYTNTWNEDYYVRPFPHGEGTLSGPALTWDSTRGIFPPQEGLPEGVFRMSVGPDSVEDPCDDIFPRQAMVILVVDTSDDVTLAAPITAQKTRIPIVGASKIPADAPRYVLIDREWIRYEKIEKGHLVLEDAAAGRGARWTWPRAHEKGAEVRVGRTFTLTVRIPAHRDYWNEKH